MTADDCLEDRWLQGSDSVVKARQDAVFTTVKLRTYVETGLSEKGGFSAEVDLEVLRRKWSVSEEVRRRFRVPVRNYDVTELEKKVSGTRSYVVGSRVQTHS